MQSSHCYPLRTLQRLRPNTLPIPPLFRPSSSASPLLFLSRLGASLAVSFVPFPSPPYPLLSLSSPLSTTIPHAGDQVTLPSTTPRLADRTAQFHPVVVARPTSCCDLQGGPFRKAQPCSPMPALS